MSEAYLNAREQDYTDLGQNRWILFTLCILQASFAYSQDAPKGLPVELQNIGITEHLGASVSVADLTFTNEEGAQVRFSEYFHKGHPVLLNLGYFGCATLCGFVLNGLLETLKVSEWTPGNQFEIVTLSIDPNEKSELARKKKSNFMTAYGRAGAEKGWHFLTGREDQIRKLTGEVGFGYKYNEEEKQFAHGAGLILLTPEGKVSRYLYGIKYEPKDLKLGLLEASAGRIGTVMDRIELFCYRYDPKLRRYSVYVTRLMQAGAAGTVFFFGGYLTLFWRRQRRKGESDSHV